MFVWTRPMCDLLLRVYFRFARGVGSWCLQSCALPLDVLRLVVMWAWDCAVLIVCYFVGFRFSLYFGFICGFGTFVV